MAHESITHLKLKDQAKGILLALGFKDKEIIVEYHVDRGKGLYYFVDVAGVKETRKVFIECGRNSNKNKINDLKNYCDTVIWLPYLPGSKVGKVMGSRINVYGLVSALESARKNEKRRLLL